MFRSHFCAGDAAAANFDIWKVGTFQLRIPVPHIPCKSAGLRRLFTGNGTHLADTARGYAADYIVGKIAALTNGRSVHMAADPSGCSIA